MKCPNCGAEAKAGKFCEYCGSEIPKEQPNVTINNNYYGSDTDRSNRSDAGRCPKCNGSNVKFHREKVATVGKTNSRKSTFSNTRNSNTVKQTAYRTVGICQECGYTWDPNIGTNETAATAQKSKGCLWWFLMLCIWPIALSVWFYKTDKVRLEKKWKIIILVVFWVFMLITSASSPSDEASTNIPNATESITQSTVSTEISNETEAPTTEIPATTEAAVSEFSVIDTFVEKYNAIAITPMTEGVEIDIHDKEGGHYRTEYRLTAFNDAVAKQYKVGDATIDIVNTKELFTGDNIRIYLSTDSVDFAEEVFDAIARIVYPTLTTEELSAAHEDLRRGSSSNLFKDITFYYIQSYNELFMDNVMYAE